MQRDYQKVQHYEQKIMAAGYIRCQEFPGFKRAPFNANGRRPMAGAGAMQPPAGPGGPGGPPGAPPGSYTRVNPFAAKPVHCQPPGARPPPAPGGFGAYSAVSAPPVRAQPIVRQQSTSFGEKSQARELARIQQEARKATARAVAAQQAAERNSAILRAQAQLAAYGRASSVPAYRKSKKKSKKKKKKKRRRSSSSSSSSSGFSESSDSSSSSYVPRRRRAKSKTKYANYIPPTRPVTRSYTSEYRRTKPGPRFYTTGKYGSSYTTSAYKPAAKKYPWRKSGL